MTRADRVIVAVDAMRIQFEERYPELAGKFVHIPNGYDRTDLIGIEPAPPPNPGGFHLLYAVSLYRPKELEAFLLGRRTPAGAPAGSARPGSRSTSSGPRKRRQRAGRRPSSTRPSGSAASSASRASCRARRPWPGWPAPTRCCSSCRTWPGPRSSSAASSVRVSGLRPPDPGGDATGRGSGAGRGSSDRHRRRTWSPAASPTPWSACWTTPRRPRRQIRQGRFDRVNLAGELAAELDRVSAVAEA